MTSQVLSLAFRRSANPMSVLIRAADRWGQWSHCAVFIPEKGYVIESAVFKGVIRTPWDEFKAAGSKWEVKEIPVPNLDAGYAWVEAQVGKKYDYGSVIANILREDMNDPERMDCAEIAEGTVVATGLDRFDWPLWKLSPNNIHMVK